MGTVFSNILNYDTLEDSENEQNRNKYNNIINTLDAIESRLENTEKLIEEIEKDINRDLPFPQHHTMEWDYYDFDPMESKKIK